MSTPTAPSSDHPFTIEVSADRMLAHVKLTAPALRKHTAADIVERLNRSDLKLLPDLLARLEPMFKSPPKGHPPLVVIAQGTPPVDDQLPFLKLAESAFDANSLPRPVAAGATVALVVAPVAGSDGVDVSGKPVARKTAPAEPSISLGDGVQRSPDGKTIIATQPGLAHLLGDRVWVQEVRQAQVANLASGPIEAPADVLIAGNAEDGGRVHAGGSIIIAGGIDSADIRAQDGVTVGGGVTMRDKGKLSAGGTLQAKFIIGGAVQVGGEVVVATEIANAKVECGGALRAESAAIFGGHIVANGGIRCNILGSAAMTKTLVESGVHAQLRQFAVANLADLLLRRKKVQRTRDIVEPLLKNQRHLTAAQKEKATELLYEAQEVHDEIEKVLDQVRQVASTAEKVRREEICVARTIYPGVTIRFVGIEATIRMQAAGPMRIISRVEHGRRGVFLIEEKTGKDRPLESRPIDDDPLLALQELLHPPTPTAADAKSKAA